MPDFREKKLGIKGFKTDSRTLRLSSYLDATKLPAPPDSHQWTGAVTQFGEMLNDQLGCCTIAGAGHAEQTWTLNSGTQIWSPSDQDVLRAYETWCGYNPDDPSTDQGGILLDVLTDWTHTGLGDMAPLQAFVKISSFRNFTLIKQVIMLLGGVMIGLDLPVTAQQQPVWDYVPNTPDNEAGSWGGHCVWVPNFDGDANTLHGLTVITWGGLQRMTKLFWENYVVEAYGCFSPLWLNQQGETPAGLDMAQLLADKSAIR